ncbi:MAG: InlB B-repeat-containing protein, partial [Treponema sp.]|nr:InlB B-repeat-containing protein [Treponema sp.]
MRLRLPPPYDFLNLPTGFNLFLILACAALIAACPITTGVLPQYTLTFDSHGGSTVQALTAAKGTVVFNPADPGRSGYTFTGWFSAASGGTLYSWPHTMSDNLTMHAQWQAAGEGPSAQYTITFNSHGGSAMAAVTAEAGTAVHKPIDPGRPGYTFRGWFSEETGGTLYSWPYPLSGNLTMHAQWRAEGEPPPQQYTITFDSHGGSAMAAVTAEAEAAVSKPADPSRPGYTFRGWFSEETGGTLYSWPYTLNANVTMHAQWRAEGEPPPQQYTVTFETHGGSAVAAITASAGTTVSEPAVNRSDYTFRGWFSAETGGTPYSWPYTLNANVTMHVQWTPYTSMTDLEALLDDAVGGSSPADPVPVKITVNLADATNGWAAILSVLPGKGKYVSLDLSDCAMMGTVFDPKTGSVGAGYVAGLV